MHKRDLASSLCSANSVIVMGHPKYESACGDTAVQHTTQPAPAWAAAARLGSASRCALPADVLLSLQMCSPTGGGCVSCLSLVLLFRKDKPFRNGICTTFRPTDTPLYSNWLNLCGMWFHSADLDCAAKARHTLGWRESRIPFSAKDTPANTKQTGNQKADGLVLSRLPRPLIPMYPFSTRCFTCLIEAQVAETQLAEGGERPGTEIRTPVPVPHEVTRMETASRDLKSLLKW